MAERASNINAVERTMRPIVPNRKNALVAGHDGGAENWACIASLIETCKLNGVDQQAYIADVLTRLVNLWPAAPIDELLPWSWKRIATSPDANTLAKGCRRSRLPADDPGSWRTPNGPTPSSMPSSTNQRNIRSKSNLSISWRSERVV